MTESKTKLIFRRSKSGFEANDPAGWDDLAIIKAYDSAVSNNLKMDENDETSEMGEVVWKRNPGVEVKAPAEKNKTNSAEPNMSKTALRKARKRKRAEQRKNKWQVGDSCMAFYQDDQRYYKASIKEIHVTQGTAVVNYVDYDDDEVVAIKDIHSESLWTDAGVDLDPKQEEPPSRKTNKRQKAVKRRLDRIRSRNPDDVELSYESSLPFMPPVNDIRPDLSSLRNMPRDANNVSKEALSSMLVSWYMAGYQTGYYKGLTSSSRK